MCSAPSGGSLSSRMSDVAEVAAAALAGREARRALLRLGLQRRHAEPRLVDERLALLEGPLIVGRAAVRAQAVLLEFRDRPGQRLGFGERLAAGHQPVGPAPVE